MRISELQDVKRRDTVIFISLGFVHLLKNSEILAVCLQRHYKVHAQYLIVTDVANHYTQVMPLKYWD